MQTMSSIAINATDLEQAAFKILFFSSHIQFYTNCKPHWSSNKAKDSYFVWTHIILTIR